MRAWAAACVFVGGCSGLLGIDTFHATDDAASGTADAPAGPIDAPAGSIDARVDAGPPDAKPLRIYDVQSPTMPVGTPVRLDGVIVTAIDAYGVKTGQFWIEDPAGGPFSGVTVFNAPAAQVAALHVGDVITIDGAIKTEFALSSDTSGRTDTELAPMGGGMITVTKTGTAAVPAPAAVDAFAIYNNDAEFEKWEGVLITLSNVSIGKTPSQVGTDPTLVQGPLTGAFTLSSALTAIDPTTYHQDFCVSTLTGVVDYFFTYQLLPRSASDLGGAGVACPAPEVGATQCANGVDDDHDSMIDCTDPSCGC